jgi:hypothetical protein
MSSLQQAHDRHVQKGKKIYAQKFSVSHGWQHAGMLSTKKLWLDVLFAEPAARVS